MCLAFCWQNNKIEKITLEHISHLQQLDTLNLQNNMLTTDGKHYIRQYNLDFVTVDNCSGSIIDSIIDHAQILLSLPVWITHVKVEYTAAAADIVLFARL